mmetsp:Transcript_3573/g.22436  ORF Transcript_3573/g.22436 Transcript_3573/m.22436 type:complete len:229 (-) Transcript_3573:638-1324(-)
MAALNIPGVNSRSKISCMMSLSKCGVAVPRLSRSAIPCLSFVKSSADRKLAGMLGYGDENALASGGDMGSHVGGRPRLPKGRGAWLPATIPGWCDATEVASFFAFPDLYFSRVGGFFFCTSPAFLLMTGCLVSWLALATLASCFATVACFWTPVEAGLASKIPEAVLEAMIMFLGSSRITFRICSMVLFSLLSFSTFLFNVLFQWFLMALSVRPGILFESSAHLLPMS